MLTGLQFLTIAVFLGWGLVSSVLQQLRHSNVGSAGGGVVSDQGKVPAAAGS